MSRERPAATRDTIAAIATPAGAGGIGVIRLSGPDAVAIAARLVGRAPARLDDRRLIHGVARDAAGARLDDVLVVAMRGPRSFTGEDVAELHGHGGTVNLARLLDAVLAAGARPAEPGEFSRRAFENDRLPLDRAEALLAVIEAGSERGWRIAQAQLAGGMGRQVAALRARATELLAQLEADIDFPEDDVDVGGPGSGGEARALAQATAALAATFRLGRAVQSGVEVAIVGPVNAGKSSLLNALAGQDRAIVTAEPGTTRDVVEARVVWRGVPVTLVNTAGTREQAACEAERAGMERGRRRAREADVIVVVHPAPGAEPPDRADARELHVVSKGDLEADRSGAALVTSALTGEGIDALRAEVLARLLGSVADADESAVVTSARQHDLLRRAAAAFAAAGAAAPSEVRALEARAGCEALAELSGERVGEEVLDALFARFCIGK